MTNAIIASTSTIYGSGYLEYLFETLEVHFNNCNEIIFIPFARPGGITHDEYTNVAAKAFKKLNTNVRGLHTFKNQ